MGAGQQPAGQGRAGVDAVIKGVSSPITQPAAALYFDPSTQAYVLVDPITGQAKSMHPVDHKVSLALGIEKGRIKSAPNVGIRLRELLNRASNDQRQAAALVAVREALSDLLSAGDIKILSVTVDVPRRDVVTTSYMNLRVGSNAARSFVAN